MASYRVDFEAMGWQSPAAGVRFKAFADAARRVRLVEFSEGFHEVDWCRGGHIGMVLQGRCEVDFDGQVIAFGPGDGIFIPPGEPHRHKARVVDGPVRVVLVEDEPG
jgi:quercetin dioxygenase-like cupin family protein